MRVLNSLEFKLEQSETPFRGQQRSGTPEAKRRVHCSPSFFAFSFEVLEQSGTPSGGRSAAEGISYQLRSPVAKRNTPQGAETE